MGHNFYCNSADGSLCCNYAGGIFYGALCTWLCLLQLIIMQVTFLYSYVARWQFQVTISYSYLYLTASFHKIDQETFKGILSGLHLTTFVNIFKNSDTLRELYTNWLQELFSTFSSLIRPMKGGDILDFWKGGNLRKGGVWPPLPTMLHLQII